MSQPLNNTLAVTRLSRRAVLATAWLQPNCERQPCHTHNGRGGGGQKKKEEQYILYDTCLHASPADPDDLFGRLRKDVKISSSCRHGRTRQHSSRCRHHGNGGEKATHSKLKRKIMNSQGSPFETTSASSGSSRSSRSSSSGSSILHILTAPVPVSHCTDHWSPDPPKGSLCH